MIRPLDFGISMASFTLATRIAITKDTNIIVGDKEHVGTPGLWELIMETTPDDKIFTNGHYDN